MNLTPLEVIRLGIQQGHSADVILALLEAAGLDISNDGYMDRNRADLGLPLAGFRPVRMVHDGRPYFLTFSQAQSDYENAQEQLGQPDANALLIMRLLRGTGTLIDMGANIGTITVPVALSGSRVLAIEPHPLNCAKLSTAARLSGLNNIRLVQCAVSDHDGEVRFGGEEYWARVVAEGEHGTPVRALKLDTILSSEAVTAPLMLKLDIEGHESAALRGAAETITKHRPPIMFESVASADDAAKSKQFLADLGYRLFVVRGTILVPRTQCDIQESLVFDFLAVPSEHMNVINGIEVRELTREECLDWVAQMVRGPTEMHHRHAANVISRWKQGNAAERHMAAELEHICPDNVARGVD